MLLCQVNPLNTTRPTDKFYEETRLTDYKLHLLSGLSPSLIPDPRLEQRC